MNVDRKLRIADEDFNLHKNSVSFASIGLHNYLFLMLYTRIHRLLANKDIKNTDCYVTAKEVLDINIIFI